MPNGVLRGSLTLVNCNTMGFPFSLILALRAPLLLVWMSEMCQLPKFSSLRGMFSKAPDSVCPPPHPNAPLLSP